MDLPTKVNLALAIASFLLAAISIIIAIITLRQNNKVLEATTRPVIGIYSESVNSGTPMFYLVVRNFGQSPAYIKSFEYDFDLTNCYKLQTERDYLMDLNDTTLAPNQSRVCMLDYNKIDKPITFKYCYLSASGKKYSETTKVNLKAGVGLPYGIASTKDKELTTISYTLQEMLKKSL